MNRGYIRISPEIFIQLLTHNNQPHFKVVDGIPHDTRVCHTSVDQTGRIIIVLEHPTFPHTEDGEPLPEFEPVIEDLRPQQT
jgi:hypothetical protein